MNVIGLPQFCNIRLGRKCVITCLPACNFSVLFNQWVLLFLFGSSLFFWPSCRMQLFNLWCLITFTISEKKIVGNDHFWRFLCNHFFNLVGKWRISRNSRIIVQMFYGTGEISLLIFTSFPFRQFSEFKLTLKFLRKFKFAEIQTFILNQRNSEFFHLNMCFSFM